MQGANPGGNSDREEKLHLRNVAESDPSVSAIILAAGYSERMGAFKPLLKIGEQAVLERCVNLFHDSGVRDVKVVVGFRSDETAPVARACGAEAVLNEQFALGMFSSVQAGVRALGPDCEAFFVLPVDIPLVRVSTVRDLIETYAKVRGPLIFPAFQGKRGHPPLIAASLREEIVSYSGEDGLRAVLRNHEDAAVDVETPDEMIGLDLDTPADYRELCERYSRRQVPTPREVRVLLTHRFRLRKKTLEHSKTVARLALTLASACNGRGHGLDMKLILAAAMLHDIAKGQRDHAARGAEMISQRGFEAVSRVVADHTDITLDDTAPVDERELVFLADKLVQGSVVTSLEARFEEAERRHCDNPTARRAMAARFEKCRKIRGRLEELLAAPLESVLARRMDESEEQKIQSLLDEAWPNPV